MISEVVGGRTKVTGSNIATVATEPMPHADQRTEHHTYHAVHYVPKLEGDTEAERKIVQELQFHIVLLSSGT